MLVVHNSQYTYKKGERDGEKDNDRQNRRLKQSNMRKTTQKANKGGILFKKKEVRTFDVDQSACVTGHIQ